MNILISYMNDCAFCLTKLIKDFEKEGAKVTAKERSKLKQKDFKNKDFIVVLAGDGTFLKTAHFVKGIPMIGVNATPQRRFGFFCRANLKNIIPRFRAWKKGKLKPIKLHRLESVIDCKGKKTIPFLALNELFIGCSRPFHVSKYKLNINGKSEHQKSSGLLVATAAGSHGWMSNAGGKKLPLTSKKFQFVTREAVHSKIVKMKMTWGVLPDKGKISITSDTEDGIVVVDSYPVPWKFPIGAKITICRSKNPVYFLK